MRETEFLKIAKRHCQHLGTRLNGTRSGRKTVKNCIMMLETFDKVGGTGDSEGSLGFSPLSTSFRVLPTYLRNPNHACAVKKLTAHRVLGFFFFSTTYLYHEDSIILDHMSVGNLENLN